MKSTNVPDLTHPAPDRHEAVLEAQEILGSGLEDLESFEEQIVQRLCPGGFMHGEASKYDRFFSV
jgi:hypothetical protein